MSFRSYLVLDFLHLFAACRGNQAFLTFLFRQKRQLTSQYLQACCLRFSLNFTPPLFPPYPVQHTPVFMSICFLCIKFAVQFACIGDKTMDTFITWCCKLLVSYYMCSGTVLTRVSENFYHIMVTGERSGGCLTRCELDNYTNSL